MLIYRALYINRTKSQDITVQITITTYDRLSMFMNILIHVKVKVQWSRYRPGVAQRVGRDIALLCHDRGTRRGWVVSSMPRPHFTPRKEPVPILQEAGWTPGPVWTGRKYRPHRDSIPDRPVRSQSLYRLSYPAHLSSIYGIKFKKTLIFRHQTFETHDILYNRIVVNSPRCVQVGQT